MLGRGIVSVARRVKVVECSGRIIVNNSKKNVSGRLLGGYVSSSSWSVPEQGEVRWYSSTGRVCGGKNEEDVIEMMNSDLSQEEARALIEAELAKLEEEEKAKEHRDWEPGFRKKPLEVAFHQEDFDEDKVKWNGNLHRRIGVLAVKLGMMPVWDEWGQRHACTVLHVDRNVVMKVFTKETDGYNAVQIGAGEYKKKNVTKPLLGHYAKCGVDECPPYLVREFRLKFFTSRLNDTHDEEYPQLGSTIHARHFTPGQNVDVTGISKGKGFQGAMKRHGFAGMPASHGTSKSHRALGSTGQCQDPGRVWKGKKMAGRMGHDQVTTQNLRILKIDRGRDLLYVKGAVPGNKGEFVQVKDAIKKPLFGTDKVLDQIPHPPIPTFAFDPTIDGCGQSGFEELMPPTETDPFLPNESELL